MEELKNEKGSLDKSQNVNALYGESSKQYQSSVGDNSAESVLLYTSYTLLILGLLCAIIVGISVSVNTGAVLLGILSFLGVGVLVVIAWASCMVIVNISNNIRQIKKYIQSKY